MLLNYTDEITILYNAGRRNTYFETERRGGNDEQSKLNKVKVKRFYLPVGNKFYDSSRIVIPWVSIHYG